MVILNEIVYSLHVVVVMSQCVEIPNVLKAFRAKLLWLSNIIIRFIDHLAFDLKEPP